ncbi:MAG TPA: CoA ester lyase [Candidatus Dormibacteraeota bacterium]|nr:CoA ester lyase [Candidatus Dormibacteraeota bacterium]
MTGIATSSPRSYLFAPGHDPKLLERVYTAGADAVLLDLEDAVPASEKDRARVMVVEALRRERAWVRVNAPGTERCAADVEAVAGLALGIRIPKVESAEEVAWVAARAPGLPLGCTIESARGVSAAREIAAAPQTAHLIYGNADFCADLRIDGGEIPTLYARSHVVLASRAAGIAPPCDGAYTRIADVEGLRREAAFARSLGFFGKSAIHPRQIAAIHDVFRPSAAHVAWARRTLEAFEAAGGAATRTAEGEMVDVPVAERARQILRLAEREERGT